MFLWDTVYVCMYVCMYVWHFVLFVADFSLRVRISAIFLLPAEVLLTDFKSALSGLAFEI